MSLDRAERPGCFAGSTCVARTRRWRTASQNPAIHPRRATVACPGARGSLAPTKACTRRERPYVLRQPARQELGSGLGLRVRGRFCGAARVYPVQNPRTARDNRPEQECLFEEPQACDVWGFGLPTPRQSRPELRLRASRAEEREGRRLVALRIVDPACMPTGPKRPARTSALGAVNDVTTRLAGGRIQSVQLIPPHPLLKHAPVGCVALLAFRRSSFG
jgi:hypothetical protein